MTSAKPPATDSSRRYNRDEDLKPAGEGEPPRPATEPRSGSASENAPSETDPVTGRPKHS